MASLTSRPSRFLHPPAPQVNPEEERLARWTSCQLSGMPLQPPCVCDELGSLFNKEPVLQVGGGVSPLGVQSVHRRA